MFWRHQSLSPAFLLGRHTQGKSFYKDLKPPPMSWTEIIEEDRQFADFLEVEGREALPHVGVVTEKSASFWLSVAQRVRLPIPHLEGPTLTTGHGARTLARPLSAIRSSSCKTMWTATRMGRALG